MYYLFIYTIYNYICFLGDIDKFINNEYLTNKNSM